MRALRNYLLAALIALPALGIGSQAQAQSDVALISTYVQPNVLLILDNSLSMRQIIWHPDFDRTKTYGCEYYDPDDIIYLSNDTTLTRCGKERKIYTDGAINGDTYFSGRYLNWLFSDDADLAYLDIAAGSNGTPSSCTGGNNFALYQRSRITTAKRAIQEVICEVNETVAVRFGIMVYREPESGEANGGYVIEEVDDYNSNQAADIVSSMNNVRPDSHTPVGETLFQAYTYFMSRTAADRPKGADGTTVFPQYIYSTSSSGTGGGYESNSSKVPVSPVQYSCQKNFIIMVTDGAPTFDDFDVASPTNTAAGFADFKKLIGDYNADGETEEDGDAICTGCESAFYLDDIAYFMQKNDMRPDMDGDQTIDTYTIGFATDAKATALLSKTAQLGNGIFFPTNDAAQMAKAIVDAFQDIIEKAQSFTAAAVPATRTSTGEQLYVNYFVPSERTPYWEGHLTSFRITSAGEIHDKTGACALASPVAGECYSGPILPTAVPFWDAYDKVPSPGTRKFSMSRLNGGVPEQVAFDTSLAASDIDVVFPATEIYPGSTANNANGLKDEIVANVRGCRLGTGVLSGDVDTPTACIPRRNLQGDVFHSDPVVVGEPALFVADPSYDQFAQDYARRDRVILAGSNMGFFHAWHAGTWDAGATPPSYNAGTGAEVFGFMPWPGRHKIRFKPIDTGARDYYFVDGSPSVADVWLYTNPTTAAKMANGSEWKTITGAGMREGGNTYFVLDITDPSSPSYPDYLFEFPAENAASSLSKYFGQTWGEPIFTRIKVAVSGDDNGGAGYERWVMIVTGGYHPNGDPNSSATYDATATEGRGIFIVDVKTGKVIAQKAFNPLSAGAEKDMVYAIASTPAVYDFDFDGFADAIAVGDLGGNLWKWVIKPIGEDRVNDGGSPDSQPAWTFRKLFQAPITTTNQTTAYHYNSFFFPPAATFKNGTLWLAWGGGERANPSFKGLPDNQGDPISSDVDNNRFYALKDTDPMEIGATPQTIAQESDMADLSNTAACADVSSYRGYYFVGAEGEKFVTSIEIFLGYVFVGGYVPTEPLDPCDLGGESSLYVFRLHCGEGFFTDASNNPDRDMAIGSGLPTDPRITVGNDGDSTNRVIINKQGGEIINFEAPPGFSTYGMWYWREVTQ
jgi:type IV pilus assembly protein PilY1